MWLRLNYAPFQRPIRILPETDYPRAFVSFPRIAGSGNEIGGPHDIIIFKLDPGASVAKWLAHLPFTSKVAGSNPFSYPEPFLRAVRRGALVKSISKLASDWLVLTPDIVLLPCFYGIRLWIWPEPLVAPRVRRALGTRMVHISMRTSQCDSNPVLM